MGEKQRDGRPWGRRAAHGRRGKRQRGARALPRRQFDVVPQELSGQWTYRVVRRKGKTIGNGASGESQRLTADDLRRLVVRCQVLAFYSQDGREAWKGFLQREDMFLFLFFFFLKISLATL